MKTRLLALLFFAWTFALIGKSANATEILFEEHTIHTASLAWASQLSYPADIDGDGDIDVVASTRMSGGPVWWFENSGGSDPTFTLHFVDNTGVTRSVFAADMDGDGDTDLLTGSSADGSGDLRWYENDGMNPPTFTRHVVPSIGNEFYTITAADIDGDGDTDIAAHSGFVNRSDDHTSWFENQGGSPPTFTERPLPTGADMSHSIRTADMDGDGDTDIILGDLSSENGKVVWYEQIDAAQTTFVLRNVGATGGNPIVNPADVDGDGDVDILVANFLGPDGRIFWYENDGGSPPTFQENAVWDNVIQPATVFPADIDGDGDIDVLTAHLLTQTHPRSGQFVWYENDGGSSPSFSEHIIATTPDDVNATWVTAADFNADGVPDVLGQEGSTTSLSRILWYETELPPPGVGGSVTGIIPETVDCLNETTGQNVEVALDGNTSWNCEAEGLLVDPGDRIMMTVGGTIPRVGDINTDGCIDRTDANILLEYVRNSGPYYADYDLNDDGSVNIADVRTLVLLFDNPGGAPCD